MEFQPELELRVQEIERVIKQYMPIEIGIQKTVLDAMDYTMSAGGKRIRPLLMKTVYDMLVDSNSLTVTESNNKRETSDNYRDCMKGIIEPFMAAIEMIHTYSLIHDDLPALDNDDYRRGRKTAHVVFGEDIAILAGDGLLNYAYETAAKAFSAIDEIYADSNDMDSIIEELAIRRCVENAITILAKNPGVYGMIGGQTVDVELTGKTLNEEQLYYIYKNKTGALIEAAMTIGAVLAGASKNVIANISETAYNIGMAFQIQDDILDETATFEELGKPIHSDKDSGKVTYVTIHGMEASLEQVERLSGLAIDSINEYGDNDNTKFLVELVKYLIHRKK